MLQQKYISISRILPFTDSDMQIPPEQLRMHSFDQQPPRIIIDIIYQTRDLTCTAYDSVMKLLGKERILPGYQPRLSRHSRTPAHKTADHTSQMSLKGRFDSDKDMQMIRHNHIPYNLQLRRIIRHCLDLISYDTSEIGIFDNRQQSSRPGTASCRHKRGYSFICHSLRYNGIYSFICRS